MASKWCRRYFDEQPGPKRLLASTVDGCGKLFGYSELLLEAAAVHLADRMSKLNYIDISMPLAY